MLKNILFVSNGYGEDIVSAHIAAEYQEQNPGAVIKAYPTVGQGNFYTQKGIELAGFGADLPTEGFIRSFKDFISDLKHGFLLKTLNLGMTLRRVSKNFDFLIIVGDPYLLFFSTIFTPHKKKYKIFIGVQQSEWYESKKPFKQHYSFIERVWMKWFSCLIFVRDRKTMDYLHAKGLYTVHCCGNPMMDCLCMHNKSILPHDRDIIGILPGSKQEAYNNLQTAFEIITMLSKSGEAFNFAIALSPQLETGKVVKLFSLQQKSTFRMHGEELYTTYEIPGIKNNIIISQKIFGDILIESKAVIGVSGTGNEQAVGLGKPVFAYWGKGPQITKKFLEAQKKLLGKSLFLFPPQAELIANEILKTLRNKSLLNEVKENGTLRMEGRGSIKIMVGEISNYIQLDSRS